MTPREVVLEFFARLGRGDVAGLIELYHPDLVYTVMGRTPLSGTYRGLPEVQRRLFAPVFARVDGLALVCEETIAEGERVVALAGGKGTAKPSGEPYQNRYVFVYRVREGRIVEVSEYLDTALVETALYGKRLVA
jgi:hypothetical protein